MHLDFGFGPYILGSMKIDYLQKILGHIKKSLTCPRCQTVFGSSEVQVLAIRDRRIDLGIKCPHCNTDARVSAEVTTQKSIVRKPTAPPSVERTKVSTQTQVSPESLEGLRRSISRLSASDIEGLNPSKDAQ